MVTENYNFLPDEAKEIRIKVFVEEQGFKQEFDELDSICTHLVTFDNDNPCATVRFYEQNSVYYIGRLAVLKEYRSKHLGAKIVNEAERLIKAKGGKEIRLHSQVQAMPFYQKQGYIPFGEQDFDEDCPHQWMKKEI